MSSIRTARTRTARTTARAVRWVIRPGRWSAYRGRLADCRGQGTVEYVGIVIVIGVLLVALKTGMGDQGGTIAHKISKSVSDAIQTVMDGKQSKG
ncbi:MAG: hypothetical protein QOH15_1846 [Gaiellales bacterium]|jgi:hypothetical protein|nr:hypothetical protein [Gaiellales bacterium]